MRWLFKAWRDRRKPAPPAPWINTIHQQIFTLGILLDALGVHRTIEGLHNVTIVLEYNAALKLVKERGHKLPAIKPMINGRPIHTGEPDNRRTFALYNVPIIVNGVHSSAAEKAISAHYATDAGEDAP